MVFKKQELLITTDFIKYSGISLRTLRRRIKVGKFAPIKEGKNLYFHFSQLPDDKARETFLKDRGLLPETKAETEAPSTLKPWQKEKMFEREALVKEYLGAEHDIPPGKKGATQKYFAKEHNLSPQTLRRHMRDYKKGGREALAPGWNPGNQEKLATEEVKKEIYRIFMRPRGPSKVETWEQLQNIFKDKCPSYRTTVGIINQTWTPAQQLLVRNKEEWNRLHSCYVNRDWTVEAVPVNDCVFSDHKQLDVSVIGPRGNVFFPWVTTCYDPVSKKFTGWAVSETPDTDAVLQAYVNHCRKHGPPRVFYVDHGKTFKSHRVSRGRIKEEEIVSSKNLGGIRELGILAELGTEIKPANPYNAREKGPLESAQKIFDRLRSEPGYRGRNVKSRPQKWAAEVRSRHLNTLEGISKKVDGILHEKNARKHPSTGRIPNSYYENFVPVIPPESLLVFFLMDHRLKKVRNGTVTIDGTSYYHEDLFKLAGEMVEIRRDPRDIRSSAIIYRDELFCTALEMKIGSYESELTLQNVKLARKSNRKARRYREEILKLGGHIDPLKLAIQLQEEEKEREIVREIRPVKASITSLHKKQRLAKKVAQALKEAPQEAETGGQGKIVKIPDSRRERILRGLLG